MWIAMILAAGIGASPTPVCLGAFQGVGLLIEQDAAVARIATALDAIGADVKVPEPGREDCAAQIPRISFSIMRIGTILQVDIRIARPGADSVEELSLSIDSSSFPKRRVLAKSFASLRPLIAAPKPAPAEATRAPTAAAAPASHRADAEPTETKSTEHQGAAGTAQTRAAEGESTEIAAAPATTPADGRADTTAPPAQAKNSIRAIPIVLLGAGVAFGIVSLALEIDAVGQANGAHELFAANAPGAQIEVDAASGRARTSEGAAVVFGLAATALAVGGLISWLTGDNSPPQTTAGAAITSEGARLVVGLRY